MELKGFRGGADASSPQVSQNHAGARVMQSVARSFIERAQTSKLTRNLAVLVGGTALAQALQLFSTPVLTRLYRPEDYGVLAVYSSILTVLTVIATMRFQFAIHLPRSNRRALHLLRLSLATSTVLCLVVGAVLLLFGEVVGEWLNIGASYRLLWLLPASVLGACAYQTYMQWATRERAFRSIASTGVRQSLGQVITQIGMGAISLGPAGLVIGYIVGQVAGVRVLAQLAPRRNWRLTRKQLRRQLLFFRRLAFRYRRFPLLNLSSSLLVNLALQLPAVLLAGIYGPAVAGIFALSQRVMAVPMRLLGQAVAQVYLSEAARLMREDRAELDRMFLRTAGYLALVSTAFFIPVCLAGPRIIAFVFGVEWAEVGTYLRLLAPMMISQFSVSPITQNAFLAERQDLELSVASIRVVLVGGGFYAAKMGAWEPWMAVGFFSAAMTFSYVLFFLVNRRVIRSRDVREAGVA
jgi:O-antigen/teichoic acid export membrane protein